MADQVEIQAELVYRDPGAAVEWLSRAFGFEPRLIITGSDGKVVFAQLAFADSEIHLGTEETERHRSPASIGGFNTQRVMIRFAAPIDAHHARAVAAGAKVLRPPRQEFYGDLTYMAEDLEGHLWVFAQRDAAPPGPPPEGWHIKILRPET